MILVGLGGSLGAASRYGIGIWITKKIGKKFPYATLLINMAGSFLLGILSSLYLSHSISEWVWLLFGIGYCGAFTTFSTFGYEAIQLLLERRKREGLLYISSSIILCTMTAYIGILITI
ncbi:fluoride efflux transporter CrcB [Fredinandcohnia sp. 179-A 10B2 NHS]|uniref:fluoride efflux transporter CrcB n=1 Tax=Fredinandcohnia sp. 179-A 10B2 NHS TaxID=3235176 RepID=UPI0039A2896B